MPSHHSPTPTMDRDLHVQSDSELNFDNDELEPTRSLHLHLSHEPSQLGLHDDDAEEQGEEEEEVEERTYYVDPTRNIVEQLLSGKAGEEEYVEEGEEHQEGEGDWAAQHELDDYDEEETEHTFYDRLRQHQPLTQAQKDFIVRQEMYDYGGEDDPPPRKQIRAYEASYSNPLSPVAHGRPFPSSSSSSSTTAAPAAGMRHQYAPELDVHLPAQQSPPPAMSAPTSPLFQQQLPPTVTKTNKKVEVQQEEEEEEEEEDKSPPDNDHTIPVSPSPLAAVLASPSPFPQISPSPTSAHTAAPTSLHAAQLQDSASPPSSAPAHHSHQHPSPASIAKQVLSGLDAVEASMRRIAAEADSNPSSKASTPTTSPAMAQRSASTTSTAAPPSAPTHDYSSTHSYRDNTQAAKLSLRQASTKAVEEQTGDEDTEYREEDERRERHSQEQQQQYQPSLDELDEEEEEQPEADDAPVPSPSSGDVDSFVDAEEELDQFELTDGGVDASPSSSPFDLVGGSDEFQPTPSRPSGRGGNRGGGEKQDVYQGRRHEPNLSLALSEASFASPSPSPSPVHHGRSMSQQLGLIQGSLAAADSSSSPSGNEWQRVGLNGSSSSSGSGGGGTLVPSIPFPPTLTSSSSDSGLPSALERSQLLQSELSTVMPSLDHNLAERMVHLLIEKEHEIYDRSRRMRELALENVQKQQDLVLLIQRLEQNKSEYNSMLQDVADLTSPRKAQASPAVAEARRLVSSTPYRRRAFPTIDMPPRDMTKQQVEVYMKELKQQREDEEEKERTMRREQEEEEEEEQQQGERKGNAERDAATPSPFGSTALSRSSSSSKATSLLNHAPSSSPPSLPSPESSPSSPLESSGTPQPDLHVPQPTSIQSARELREVASPLVDSTTTSSSGPTAPASSSTTTATSTTGVPRLNIPVVSLPMSAPPTSREGAPQEDLIKSHHRGAGTGAGAAPRTSIKGSQVWEEEEEQEQALSEEEEGEEEEEAEEEEEPEYKSTPLRRESGPGRTSTAGPSSVSSIVADFVRSHERQHSTTRGADSGKLSARGPTINVDTASAGATSHRAPPLSPTDPPPWPGTPTATARLRREGSVSGADLPSARGTTNYSHVHVPPPSIVAGAISPRAVQGQGQGRGRRSTSPSSEQSPAKEKRASHPVSSSSHARRSLSPRSSAHAAHPQPEEVQRSSKHGRSSEQQPSYSRKEHSRQHDDEYKHSTAAPRRPSSSSAGAAAHPPHARHSSSHSLSALSIISDTSLPCDVSTLQSQLTSSRREGDKLRELVLRLKADRVKLKQKVEILKQKLAQARAGKYAPKQERKEDRDAGQAQEERSDSRQPASEQDISPSASSSSSAPSASTPSHQQQQQQLIAQLALEMQQLRRKFKSESKGWQQQRQEMEEEIRRLKAANATPPPPPPALTPEQQAALDWQRRYDAAIQNLQAQQSMRAAPAPVHPREREYVGEYKRSPNRSPSPEPIIHILKNDTLSEEQASQMSPPRKGRARARVHDTDYLSHLSPVHARSHKQADSHPRSPARRVEPAPAPPRSRSSSVPRHVHHHYYSDARPRISREQLNRQLLKDPLQQEEEQERARREYERRERERQQKLREKREQLRSRSSERYSSHPHSSAPLASEPAVRDSNGPHPPSSSSHSSLPPTRRPHGIFDQYHRPLSAWDLEREVEWQNRRAERARRDTLSLEKRQRATSASRVASPSPTRGTHRFIREEVREKERAKLFAKRYGEEM